MNKTKTHHKTTHGRTLTLIITLIFVTAGLFWLALTNQYSQPPQPKIIQTPAQPTAQTILTFENPSMNPVSNSGFSLPITITTGKNTVTAVQLDLAYDPKLLTNVAIQKGTFFTEPVILLNNIDSKTGKISFALGINPNERGVNGEGVIATLTFQTKSKIPEATNIYFFPKTLVTAEGIEQSVLKSTKPAEFIVGENVKYTP